jgi:hypothetical protein
MVAISPAAHEVDNTFTSMVNGNTSAMFFA